MHPWPSSSEEHKLRERIQQVSAVLGARLLEESVEHSYSSGKELFDQGDAITDVMFVCCGLVKLSYRDADGREAAVSLHTAGGILGSEGAVTGQHHVLCGQTVTPCVIRRIPASVFRKRVSEDHQLGATLADLHALKLIEQVNARIVLSTLTARQRVLLMLRGLSDSADASGHQSESVKLKLPVRLTDLAQLAEITPETLSRILRELEQHGLLERGRGWLRVQLCTHGAASWQIRAATTD